jgi:fibronectin type 3 domain-containing protein
MDAKIDANQEKMEAWIDANDEMNAHFPVGL